jgi:hypothetical protein
LRQVFAKIKESFLVSFENAKYFSCRAAKFKFEWQKGYGAFTHSRSQIDTVVKYILLQEEHHKKQPFKEEYLEMLEKNDVAFNQEYLFEFFSDIY